VRLRQGWCHDVRGTGCCEHPRSRSNTASQFRPRVTLLWAVEAVSVNEIHQRSPCNDDQFTLHPLMNDRAEWSRGHGWFFPRKERYGRYQTRSNCKYAFSRRTAREAGILLISGGGLLTKAVLLVKRVYFLRDGTSPSPSCPAPAAIGCDLTRLGRPSLTAHASSYPCTQSPSPCTACCRVEPSGYRAPVVQPQSSSARPQRINCLYICGRVPLSCERD
jgi:hypothetical protein